MARDSTMYRFEVDLSDTDRGVYGPLTFRAAFHPSEAPGFFVARLMAYCLNSQDGLELSQGISDPDVPALRVMGPDGRPLVWIEVGQPDARRLHKASKTGAKVMVYSHKDPYQYLKNLAEEKIHRVEELRIYSFEPGFLESVGKCLDRDNKWGLTVSGGTLYLTAGRSSLTSELREGRPASG